MSWRFIPFKPCDGAMNMAVDEAILQAHLNAMVPPTLRLYCFDPPTVSIGLNQKFDADLAQSIKGKGLDIVRRPTGGRAVLHSDELTYSFVAKSTEGEDGFLSTSISQAYKQICAALQNAFSILGVPTEIGNANTPYRDLQDCFLATTGSDLHFRGKKIMGSAQLRRRAGVLQHGSVLLNQAQTSMNEVLGSQSECRRDAGAPGSYERHANLFEAAGREIPMDEMEHAFKRGFEQAFDVVLVPGELTEWELDLAAKLRTDYQAEVGLIGLTPLKL